MRRISSVGLVLALLAARGVAAQDTLALVPGDREASAELAKIVEATRLAGLPIDPILAKVGYGVNVVHAAPSKIVAAARAIAARLEAARDALAPQPTPKDIEAGENALSSGVSRQALQDIRKVSTNKPVAVPLGVLAQLVSNKVPEKRAAKYVTDLIRRGATPEMLVALGNEVNADIALGSRPSSAFELRMSRLNAVLGIPTSNGDAAATVPTSLQTGDGKKKP